MQSTSLRSNIQNHFYTSFETSTYAAPYAKYAKNAPIKRPATSDLPRTSNIDSQWDLPNNESDEMQPDSELSESGIRQSCPDIENQTLRPGIVPVFASDVLIFEADSNNNAVQGRPESRRVLERLMTLLMGIAIGIGLTVCVETLIERNSTSVERIHSSSNQLADASIRQVNLDGPSNTLIKVRPTNDDAHAQLPQVEVPSKSVIDLGMAPVNLSTKPLIRELPKTQNARVQRKHVMRRPIIEEASDNPY